MSGILTLEFKRKNVPRHLRPLLESQTGYLTSEENLNHWIGCMGFFGDISIEIDDVRQGEKAINIFDNINNVCATGTIKEWSLIN